MNARPPDSATRFGRRQWRRRLRASRPWLIGAVAAGGLVFAAWVMLFSSWLGVSHLQVTGTHRVTAAQVLAAADVSTGTPMARVDLSAVADRVEQIPAVASAAVRRGWPHTVVISVTERQPVAAVHQQGAWWLMDRTGALFASSDSRDPAEPVVEIDGSPPPDTLRQVAVVLGVVPLTLADETKRVTASSPDSISLHLKNGSEVRWGNASESALKVRVLAALLPSHARIYDVSAPSEPATEGKLEASG